MENADNYDFVYVANMARADFFKSSLKDEAALAQFIKDMVDDPDQADGFISIDFMPIATIMVSAFHGMMYYD